MTLQQLSAPVYQLKRQAKSLAKSEGIALHKALDQLARAEGFRSWSHLAASLAETSPGKVVLATLKPGELMLLGARPGQGKTLMGLELLALASAAGRDAVFFTLEYTPEEALERLQSIGQPENAADCAVELDCSDRICADYIISRQAHARAGTVMVIDYLQLLDQRREYPPLTEQIACLKRFAADRSVNIVFITQIDRTFEQSSDSIPGPDDIRMPNPVNLEMFARTCFIHDGQVQMH